MKKEQVVLIVEDEFINRKILTNLLSSNYKIIEAANGSEAWNIITKEYENISAVILDLIMPIMDGYQLLNKIQSSSFNDLPVIVTTGDSDKGAEQKALEIGAWDFITKPYDARVLATRLKNAIARSQISMYEKMQNILEHDKLTGLYNREKMFECTRQMIDEHSEYQFIFIRIDIDRFALFNTSFGEQEGNKLLTFLGGSVAKTAENYGFCTYGRMNADVFCACFLYNGNQESIIADIDELQKCLTAYRSDYRLESSTGVCIIDDLSLSIDEYYFRASLAAQKCKHRIESHIAFYDSSTGKKIATEINITNDMQTALDQKQFVVYLQPKVNLTTESICGAEALVRWIHPKKGLISPGEFIPIFESNGFISKVDYYVWEETCRMLRDWQQAGKKPFPISVNISRISLYNPKLTSLMTNLVNKYQISPSLLQLEVTESAYMSNPKLMEATINSLHESGFTILMDDFGSGYSSLNTLKTITVDILKIDMKFLPVKDEIERGEIILTSVIKMASWLGMGVIVEGVETRQQRDFLEGVGCDCIQGYFYSKPIPVAEYEEKYINERDYESDSVEDKNKRNIIAPHHNVTVLIIDGSKADSNLLSEKLKNLYHVHISENAEEGLIYLKKNVNKIRLIMIDNVMPGMSGLDFIKYCHHDNTLSAIPIIMITSHDSVDIQLEAFKSGAYDYISKPFVEEVVIARIKHVMEVCCHTSIFDSVEQEYKKKTEIDTDTGLLNKHSFWRLGTQLMSTFPGDNEALMVIDIDDYNGFIQKFGTEKAKELLFCISDSMTNSFRKTDILGHFGGDEFIVLMTKLPNLNVAKRKAIELIKKVQFDCREQLHTDISVSVGLSFSEHNDTVDTLFARADQSLYEAKNSGKGKVVIYGECVAPIENDDKPVILICSEEPQLYPAIALAYGQNAAFARITSFPDLRIMINKYQERICAICIDMNDQKKMKLMNFTSI